MLQQEGSRAQKRKHTAAYAPRGLRQPVNGKRRSLLGDVHVQENTNGAHCWAMFDSIVRCTPGALSPGALSANQTAPHRSMSRTAGGPALTAAP